VSLNYNSYSFADVAIAGVNGNRGLGISQLSFSVEFRIAQMAPKDIVAHDFRMRVSVASEGGGAIYLLGIATPESALVLDTRPGVNPRCALFHLMLNGEQVFEIERIRQGNGLQFHVQVYGASDGQYGPWPMNDSFTYSANLSTWAKVLADLGGDEILLFGIPLPASGAAHPMRAAVDRIKKAHRALLSGHYDSVVSDCRLAIESAQSISGDDAAAEKLFKALRLDPSNAHKKMSKREREVLIGQVARHYAHLAHHVDEQGQPEFYSRDDALMLLSIATAVVSAATRRLGEVC
jgi:hypothetical protein